MAKKIILNFEDGSSQEYKSTLFKGYHLHEGADRICITEKNLFGREKLVTCYWYEHVDSYHDDRCSFCESVNPSQRSNFN